LRKKAAEGEDGGGNEFLRKLERVNQGEISSTRGSGLGEERVVSNQRRNTLAVEKR